MKLKDIVDSDRFYNLVNQEKEKREESLTHELDSIAVRTTKVAQQLIARGICSQVTGWNIDSPLGDIRLPGLNRLWNYGVRWTERASAQDIQKYGNWFRVQKERYEKIEQQVKGTYEQVKKELLKTWSNT